MHKLSMIGQRRLALDSRLALELASPIDALSLHSLAFYGAVSEENEIRSTRLAEKSFAVVENIFLFSHIVIVTKPRPRALLNTSRR